MRFLLAALGDRHFCHIVPAQGFLNDRTARFIELGLALNFISGGTREGAEAVQVLDLCTGAEFRAAGGTNGNVGFETQYTFFHIPGIHAQITQDSPYPGGICQGCLHHVHIRLGDDLQQRNAGPVVIDQGMRALMG